MPNVKSSLLRGLRVPLRPTFVNVGQKCRRLGSDVDPVRDHAAEKIVAAPINISTDIRTLTNTVASLQPPHSQEFDVSLTVAHIAPLISLLAGLLILIAPALLNYIVAIYLIVAGVVDLNEIHHFLS